MKISDIVEAKPYSVSFEVFPPKTEDAREGVTKAAREIAALHPAFMSVTYGAGGGTSEYTAEIAHDLQEHCGVPMMAHLTCITSTHEHIREQLDLLKSKGVENILALRGDIPEGFELREQNYHHAIELVRDIKAYAPEFCIAGACYPDTHPDAPSQKEDIRHLKEKVDAGMDFLITQMFFDNPVFYSYMYKLREAGITVPVHPGIMPIVNAKQMKRTLKLSGTTLPERFRRILDTFGETPEAMRQAGIAYATDQIIDLFANGIRSVHVYSMNVPSVAKAIMENVSQIIS
ncbi:MAG: methylenetetrahydrofolate reductase [NAD(P)H] [Ruminococcaceae bacterium]|nr:methylenetetrahydrofolate reductase [NAD(P)H] [Oscillospiraceae bacterium]